MAAMPRPRPPYLVSQTTRHGLTVWYVRIGKGKRTRIRGDFGSPEFTARYKSAVAGEAPPDTSKFNAKTVGWLIERYRDSSAWAGLSASTRRQREQILRKIAQSAGREPMGRMTKAAVQAGIDRRSAAAGKHFLQTVRGLFRWAVKAQHADGDPTSDLEMPSTATEGHRVWTEEEVAIFESRHPRGTRERVAFDLLLYTGLRRGDVVRLGRPHIKKGIATIRTEKHRRGTEPEVVTIPILPPLQETLDAGPVGEMTFICDDRRRPMKKESFGNWFRGACRTAGVPGSAHGLRKAGATRAAENGATEAELDAMFGWRGGRTSAIYTRKANRVKLSMRSASKLLSERDENLYSLTLDKVRDTGEKSS